MAERRSPQFGQGQEGARASSWNSYDQQASDEDDDEPRLMIDTSEDDEDGSGSQSSSSKTKSVPLNFPTEVSPERIKVLAEVTPTLDKFVKDIKIPPELDKLVKDASANLKKKNINETPENFVKAMNAVMSSPSFQKAIFEMELSPSLEKALDEMKQIQQSQVGAKMMSSRDTKFPTAGCEKPTKEASSVGVNPLLQLQDFVWKPWNAFPGGVPPNTKISSASVSGSQGCEIVPIAGVSSKTIPTIQTQPASMIKCNVKPRSTTKRGGSQLPRLPQLTSAPTKSKTAVPLANSTGLLQPPPLQKRPPSKIDYVLNKLQNAAREEQQMQELQRMSESAEIENFKKFQSFIKTRYTDVSAMPTSFMNMSDLIGRTGRMVTNHSMPLPPALTIIPRQEGIHGGRKSNCRRSPPPMVPIENFASLRKPLNDDQVVLRLKRLGTDIELERMTTTPPMPSQPMTDWGSGMEEEDDDDPLIPLSVDCILSTEPIVTIDEKPDALPLRCFDVDPPITKKGGSRAYIPHPPPSLIPISCTSTGNSMGNRFVPILPNSIKPPGKGVSSVINRKSKRKQKTSFKSDIAKLAHALVQPAGALKNNEIEIMNALCRPAGSFQNDTSTRVREVEIFKIDDTPGEKTLKQPEMVAENSLEKVIKRLKEKPMEDKTVSECTDTRSEGTTAELEIELVEASSEKQNYLLPEAVMELSKFTENEIEDSKQAETIETKDAPKEANDAQEINSELQSAPVTTGNPSTPRAFVFHADDAVSITLLESGRKMYTCKICSGVYCKMYSAKKHYFRLHVNPRTVSERDVLKFGLEMSSKKSSADEGFYRCNECMEIFVTAVDLKKHLLVHPVEVNESSDRSKTRAATYQCENCDMTFAKKKLYIKHISKCSSVSKAPVPEPTTMNPPEEQDNLEEFDEEKKEALGISRMCLFCDLTFTSTSARKTHVLQQHHPKRKQQSCSYCKNKKFSDLKDLLKHICEAHNKRYFGCAICKIRFKTKGDLTAHNAESHTDQEMSAGSSKTVTLDEKTQGKSASTVVTKSTKVFKCTKCSETFPTDRELKRHRKKGHNVVKQTSSTKTNSTASSSDPYEHKYRTTSITSVDYETEFYRNVSQNIRYNNEFCLDGKIIDVKKPNDLKTVTRSSVSQQLRMERGTENELSFEDMYGAQNMNSQFISNVSRLHLGTQLAVLRKANVLDTEPQIGSASNTYKTLSKMAEELALTENPGSQEATDENENRSEVIFTGEWTRPKKYICSTCFARFSNFWDMEDHRWVKHPNVWVSNYEFPADQAPGSNWGLRRCLASEGALGNSLENSSSSAITHSTCTKCQKVITPVAEFHKHILECGGDTTWMSTMFASSSLKKHKKYRTYCGRRRRNTARVRGLKRNIPTTPIKIIGLPKNRQKAGDTETIQKMIANLPPKRITRRIIQFDDADPKNPKNNVQNETNILTRKRRERLDAKTSAQIAKTFARDEFITVRLPDAKKKKKQQQKDDVVTTVATMKSSKSSKSKSPTEEVVEPQEACSDNSPLISVTEVCIKEEAVSPSVIDTVNDPPVETPVTVLDLICTETIKQEDEEEPELDLEKIEPIDSDSMIPDSSVILAAMRETMRQTDAVIPAQIYNVVSKKRKHEDSKESKPEPIAEPPVEPIAKRSMADLTVTEVQNATTNLEEKAAPVKAKGCSRRGKTRSTFPRELRSLRQQKAESRLGNDCDESSPALEAVCVEKENDKSAKEETSVPSIGEINETTEKTTEAVINDPELTDEASKTCTEPEKPSDAIKKTKQKTSITNKKDSEVISEVSKVAVKKTAATNKDVKEENEIEETTEANTNTKRKTAAVGGQVRGKATTKKNCRVCYGQTHRNRLVCDNCSSIARRNKICAVCKQTWLTVPKTNAICDSCLASSEKKNADGGLACKQDMLEWWTLCKVCRRTNHRIVCSSCVVMSQKHKICARCNVRWEDPEKTGMPVCPPCEKEWYPPKQETVENTEKCNECSTLQKIEVTLRKSCGQCNTSPRKTSNESTRKSSSSEISIQVNEVEDENATVTVAAPVVPTIPTSTSVTSVASCSPSEVPVPAVVASTVSTSSTTSVASSTPTGKPTSEENQSGTSPSKKNVILICKGCYGLYDKVSAYKQHCDTCQARVSCMDDKKPLLGFAKRNAKGGVEIAPNDMNGGPSFEILEGVQIKSFPVNENGKIESELGADGQSQVSVYDSDSSTSSRRHELCKSPKQRRSVASEESINDAIESAIQTVCYGPAFNEDDDSESAGTPSEPGSIASSRRSSILTTENSSPEMLENFEKVKNQLVLSLETSSSADATNTEIPLANKESTPAAEENTPKKKKTLVRKKKTPSTGRTTRSSLNKLELDISKALEESLKTSAKAAKKRKIENDLDLEIGEEDLNIKATRLRRKQPVETTNRTLRSRSKTEVRDSIDNGTIEEDTTEPAPSTSAKTKRSLKKKVDDVESPDEGNEDDSALADEQSGKEGTKKCKTDASSLGFAVVKSNSRTRKNVKRTSFSSLESLSKNELSESDRELRRHSCESDLVSEQSAPDLGNETTDEASLTGQNPCDFLGPAAPSTSAAVQDESVTLNGFSYDESMPLDGYETNAPFYFDEGQPEQDGGQTNSWYSTAISFLDQRSLGSILDSVNELLSRPEVASSCANDTVGSQHLQDVPQGETLVPSYDEVKKTNTDENLMDLDDDKPTIMDLDHQPTYNSGAESKEEQNRASCGAIDTQSVDDPCEKFNECEQSYPDISELKDHLAEEDETNMPTTRSAANGRLRSSTRSGQNGTKTKQRCSHCQKVVVGKSEMTVHLKDHLKTFASNKNNADFLKKCIAEKLEDLFFNKALSNYMKAPLESSSVRNNPPLKILSQLNAAKKNQYTLWKSAFAHMLNLDSGPTAATTSAVARLISAAAEKPLKLARTATKTSTSAENVASKSDSVLSDGVESEEGYPCPMCSKTFPFTHTRNQHLIMVHAPRQSTHRHLRDAGKRKENVSKSIVKNENSSRSEATGVSDTKIIRSYLLNDSVNTCLEAKKETVGQGSADTYTKTVNALRKQIGRPAETTNTLSLSISADLQSAELPPALEPATSGEQIPNNTDRSPPKLEAPVGITVTPVPTPSILRQNLTSTSSTNASTPINPVAKNTKPCRKKMSKKEINLPPSVVKYKAEQALLELSINKFRKIRS